ncbi:hypothetical protein PS627_03516 [Pseudomonas fluorescens]|uniref:DUF2946 domain-containing protein n=1 Tax=Pseudomonas fluorescens TaxID=294 RepID=UPI001250EBF4|nr:DUF2946 domain-containing protein [Pseudomonas fluorescens]CAG8869443.1 hypothetical protein PS627_03516 [Pseudomonas fluorescens]VVP95121.1 hypothetical protein PS910_03264 [Pseudomonas fluorescens]
MTPHRPALAWIACLAVLFNLLAMPLSSAAPKGPDEQLLWGAFCSSVSGKAKAEIVALGKLDLGQQGDDHSNMQHCWCCSGAAPVLALPGHVPPLTHPQPLSRSAATPLLAYQPTPRQQWPTINPRASPLS